VIHELTLAYSERKRWLVPLLALIVIPAQAGIVRP
jgi:hypothetical protein